MKLSKRLQSVYDFIPPHTSFADIGTDHGYIPVAACLHGRVTFAIACDIAEGPLAAAKEHIHAADLDDFVECRLSDGLASLQVHEVDGIVICGLGGPLMKNILSNKLSILNALDYMILQPMSGAATIRKFLYAIGWHIQQENLVYEDSHLYEIIFAKPGKAVCPDDILCEIGPCNWDNRSTYLKQHIHNLIDKYKIIDNGLAKSKIIQSKKINKIRAIIKGLEDKVCQLN